MAGGGVGCGKEEKHEEQSAAAEGAADEVRREAPMPGDAFGHKIHPQCNGFSAIG